MRLKHRVYICRVDFAADASGEHAAHVVTTNAVYSAIRATATDAFGDVGCAALTSALAVRYYSPTTHLALVRGPGAYDAQMRGVLALVRTIAGAPVAVRVLQCAASTRTLHAYSAHFDALTSSIGLAVDASRAGVPQITSELLAVLAADAGDAE